MLTAPANEIDYCITILLTALYYTELLSGGLLFKWSTTEENPRRICVLLRK